MGIRTACVRANANYSTMRSADKFIQLHLRYSSKDRAYRSIVKVGIGRHVMHEIIAYYLDDRNKMYTLLPYGTKSWFRNAANNLYVLCILRRLSYMDGSVM